MIDSLNDPDQESRPIRILHISSIHPAKNDGSNSIVSDIVSEMGDNVLSFFLIPRKTLIPKQIKEIHSGWLIDFFGIPKTPTIIPSWMSIQLNERTMRIPQVDIIHSHSLIYDGLFAYAIHRRHGIPFIQTIRGTDVDYHYRYRFLTRPLMREILLSSEAITFPSVSTYKKAQRLLKKSFWNKIDGKSVVIPNGIKPGIQNASSFKSQRDSPRWRLISVASLDKNKNISVIIEAMKILVERQIDANLTVIGDGKQEQELNRRVIRLGMENRVFLLGRVSRNKVFEAMRSSDLFVLVSKRETFGLVYLEALFSGIPIIYSEGEAVDGTVPVSVGKAVKPVPESVANGICEIISEYSAYKKSVKDFSENESSEFELGNIVTKYLMLYRSVLEGNNGV